MTTTMSPITISVGPRFIAPSPALPRWAAVPSVAATGCAQYNPHHRPGQAVAAYAILTSEPAAATNGKAR
jgi:hypothetical protein